MTTTVYLNRRELVLVVLSEGPGRALLQQVVVVQQDPHVVEHLVELARRRMQYKVRDYSHFFLVRNHRISVRRHLTYPTGTHTPPPPPPPMSKARVRCGGHGPSQVVLGPRLRFLAPRRVSWCRSRRCTIYRVARAARSARGYAGPSFLLLFFFSFFPTGSSFCGQRPTAVSGNPISSSRFDAFDAATSFVFSHGNYAISRLPPRLMVNIIGRYCAKIN